MTRKTAIDMMVSDRVISPDGRASVTLLALTEADALPIMCLADGEPRRVAGGVDVLADTPLEASNPNASLVMMVTGENAELFKPGRIYRLSLEQVKRDAP